MDFDRVVDIARITPRHRNRHRNVSRLQGREHERVAAREPALGELEAAEAIVLEWVRPREINRELRARALERRSRRR